jgi:hypothetical protein
VNGGVVKVILWIAYTTKIQLTARKFEWSSLFIQETVALISFRNWTYLQTRPCYFKFKSHLKKRENYTHHFLYWIASDQLLTASCNLDCLNSLSFKCFYLQTRQIGCGQLADTGLFRKSILAY